MREPAVAGSFYPAVEKKLRSELKALFDSVSIGSLPEGGPAIMGLVSPHAGYYYSGRAAACGFRAMERGGMPDTVLVIGPNHSGLGSGIGLSNEDWRTPLGVMRCDRDLASLLDVGADENSHVMEHSMEVQLPFVQYLDPSVKQLCISMLDQRSDSVRSLGEAIASALTGYKRRVCIVASSDFTHCGWNYGLPVPKGKNAGEYARDLDVPVIDRLLKMDVQGAYRERDRLRETACGLGPVTAMVTALSQMKANRTKLLTYYTSYDISPAQSAVGYASIALWRS
ncbi:MAG: AmmeMemoRadiSam system protein B [Candidatus Thermoplasmatota archaeon]|nr:AmmeMemoRadiSam system protein B [Candidatus Thermoplasmatota archaeon]